MPNNFWLLIAVDEAEVVANGVLATNKELTAQQTKALQDFVKAAAEIAEAF